MPEPGPHDIDVSKPSAARLYDYYLGGTHNYAVDKAFATYVLETAPFIRDFARDNRGFLRRAVRFCVAQGVTQFLDIGSGVPTVGNVHEVAQELAPHARVVYVDNDLDAVTASRDMLHGNDSAAAIAADLRQPEAILDHPDTRRLIDFTEPVALLIVSTLPFVPNTNGAHHLVGVYRDTLPNGSYLALSHVTADDASADVRARCQQVAAAYDETADPATLRSRQEFAGFFSGFDLVDPGVVYATDWRPDEPVDTEAPARPCNYAAVGYKP
jgi:S-adenosyl methyltransferase